MRQVWAAFAAVAIPVRASLVRRRYSPRYAGIPNLKATGTGALDFSGIPAGAPPGPGPAHGHGLGAPTIARMPRQRRIATLVAFVANQEISALDDCQSQGSVAIR